MPDPQEGFVFAATGERYAALAQRTARNLRAVMPDWPIDLFTDQTLADTIFDKIIPLELTTHRPKMEALRRSRFQRTIYLDCDVVAVADVSDIFELLHHFDIVGAHENYRAGPVALTQPGTPIPSAFPQINSGVLGVKKSPATQSLLTRWQNILTGQKRRLDQPILRRLLFEKRASFYALPYDYNLMHVQLLFAMGRHMSAPRLLHLPRLNRPYAALGPKDQPIALERHISKLALYQLDRLLRSDPNTGGTEPPSQTWSRTLPPIGILLATLWHFLRTR